MSSRSRPTDRQLVQHQIEVLDRAEAFFESAVLFALLRLRIFEAIGEGGADGGELAARTGARRDTLERLLNAAVAVGLLDRAGELFRPTAAARAVLGDPDGEHYLGDWVRNLDFFRTALADLDRAVLTSGPTVDPADHIGDDAATTRTFGLAMHNYAALRGRELAHFLDTEGCRTLLDVGCGPGTYAFHLAQRNPGLEVTLADLPGVLEVAREVAERYSLEQPIHYVGVDAVAESIPGAYDLVLVSNTLHMLGEEASRTLLGKLYDNVAPGGSLVIQAQYLRDDRAGGRWPAFLDLVQLCITPQGRNHTMAETEEWMREAGFTDIERHRMSVFNTNSFLRGRRPA